MKILIIDDDENFSGPFKKLLEPLGHECKTLTNPETGFKIIDHSYDLVFIDFKFDVKDDNGAQLCARIKAKCPLVIRVLITAYGDNHEVIDEFINAGFHGYFAKTVPMESVKHYYERIPHCIEQAKQRFESEIQTSFKPNELQTVKSRLKLIEQVLEQVDTQYSSNYFIAAGVHLLETGRELDIQLLISFNNATDKKAFSQKHQLGDYRKFTKFFQLHEKDHKEYTENALKTRYVLLDDTKQYKKAKAYYKPINAIRREFKIS